jgi:uncharacterized protein YjiS (DUF1127 family)
MFHFRILQKLLIFWIQRRRQRILLAELSDQHLRDIGITRYEALKEAKKPFWR